jgi:ABC-2 type transport system permease protein
MSHIITTTRRRTGSGPDASPPILADMRDALGAEWIKLRTVPGTIWLLAAVVTTTVALGVITDAVTSCPAGRCPIDPVRTSLTGIYLSQAIVVILAVTAISGEYSSRLIRTTFTAMPRRTTVLAAKATVITGLVLAAGAIAVAVAVLAGQLILHAHGFTPAHGYPPLTPGDAPVLRAAIGSVLYLALIALLSLGVATAVATLLPPSGPSSAWYTSYHSSPPYSATPTCPAASSR